MLAIPCFVGCSANTAADPQKHTGNVSAPIVGGNVDSADPAIVAIYAQKPVWIWTSVTRLTAPGSGAG